MAPLMARTAEPVLPMIETAARAMLHSFYTEIERILKIIALELDRRFLHRNPGIALSDETFIVQNDSQDSHQCPQ
jgi:hypothetical protein